MSTFGFALQGTPPPPMKQVFSDVTVGVLFMKNYYFHEVSLTTFWLNSDLQCALIKVFIQKVVTFLSVLVPQ